jgi:hypothetical protein
LIDAFLMVRLSPVNTTSNASLFFGVLITWEDGARQVLLLQERVEFAGRLRGSLTYGISDAGRYPNPPLADVDDDEGAQATMPRILHFHLHGIVASETLTKYPDRPVAEDRFPVAVARP